MTTKVYLTQKPTVKNPATGLYEDKFDLRPALEYGEIVELLHPGNIRKDHERVMQTLLQQLRNFKETDYLLALGDPVVMCAAACIALDITGGAIQVLKWDRHKRGYLPYSINLRYGTAGEGVFQQDEH